MSAWAAVGVPRNSLLALAAASTLMLAFVTACGVLPFGVGRSQRPLPPARLATVGVDGRVSALPLEGGSPLVVSDIEKMAPAVAAVAREEPSMRWPAWSPDGTRLAFMRVLVGNNGDTMLSQVWTVAPDGADPRAVWEADDQDPVYFAWAPDSRRIAMLVERERNLDLVLVDTSGTEPARRLGRGNPFYYVWSGDSQSLLVHVGSSTGSGASAPELGIIRLGQPGREPDTYRTLGVTPGGFRTPGWSADGRVVAFVAPGPDGAPAVSVADPAGGDVTRLATASSFVALALSSDGTRLAWGARSEQDRVAYEGLEVVSTDGRTRTQVTTARVVAFFWSPDGQRLAFASLDAGGNSLAWNVADANGSNARRLGPFTPTSEQIQLLAFFDQYAISHGLWAPDGSALVYAVGQAGEPRMFGAPSTGTIQALATDGSRPGRTLTGGNLVTMPVPAP